MRAVRRTVRRAARRAVRLAARRAVCRAARRVVCCLLLAANAGEMAIASLRLVAGGLVIAARAVGDCARHMRRAKAVAPLKFALGSCCRRHRSRRRAVRRRRFRVV